jgi:hypothetical protein
MLKYQYKMLDFPFYPKGYNYNHSVKFFKDYQSVFTYAYLFYLPVCQILGSIPFVQNGMVSRKTIKHIGFVWNIGLSVFSAIGTYFTLPFLLKCLFQDGLDVTLKLENPLCDFRYIPSVSYWSTLFVASKIPELGDTFLYIIKNGKQHIFLHWYHHLFTGVYAYFVTIDKNMPNHLGLWMVSLNFFVHTFMYAYYAIMEITGPECGLRIWAMKNASFITTIQTLQMFIMMFIFIYDKVILGHDFDHFGFGMYLVYAVLFSKLYIEKYFKSKV